MLIIAQYGSGAYGDNAYGSGSNPGAPDTGLLQRALPDDPMGWVLLIGGILAIAISLVLLYKNRKKK